MFKAAGPPAALWTRGMENEIRASPIIVSLLLFLVLPCLFPGTDGEGASIFPEPGQGSRAAPPGYSTLDDLVDLYPSFISGSAGEYRVSRSLELGASRPLYISSGQSVLFDEGTYLNLSAPPVFEGTTASPVLLGPSQGTEAWGGISLWESDPSTPSVMRNVTIERAIIGIRSAGSDLHLENGRIGNCTRSGMEINSVQGPLSRVSVVRTSFQNCTFYGVQLTDVREAYMDTVTMLSCGTGIRAYRTDMSCSDIFVLDSSSVGVSLVKATFGCSNLWAHTSTQKSISTAFQLLVHGSNASITGGRLGRANICAQAISSSSVSLSGMEVGPSFTDGVQSNSSRLSMASVTISGCKESAIHSVGSTVHISSSDLTDNGKGTGAYVFSSLYLRTSSVVIERTGITGSGDAHVEGLGSEIVIGNSTLGRGARPLAILDGSTTLDLVDTSLPGAVNFVDGASRIRQVDLFRSRVTDYATEAPVPGATVDLLGPDRELIGSYMTGTDGLTPQMSVVAYLNTSSGSVSGFPLWLGVSKVGYEMSMVEVTGPSSVLEVELYPPNEPPTLSLLQPLNGTVSTGLVVIEGYLTDDLGIHRVQVRVGSGPWSTVEVDVVGATGYFLTSFAFGGIPSGPKLLYIQAFDGSHSSPLLVRTVQYAGPSMNDTDQDGLLDSEEDKNGNGVRDEGETDPFDDDSDGDGLKDGLELDMSDLNSTDPLDPDSDGDFLLDGVEDANTNGRVDVFETDPLSPDTDGDGLPDKDDRYPLDPERGEEKVDGDDTTIILLVVSILTLLMVCLIVYVLYVRLTGAGGGRDKKLPDRGAQRPGGRGDRPISRPSLKNSRPPSRGPRDAGQPRVQPGGEGQERGKGRFDRGWR